MLTFNYNYIILFPPPSHHRDLEAKSEMKVELKCRARAYVLFREASERMVALAAGRPLSSCLEDGVGDMHAGAVQEVKKIEQLVTGCDWWIKNKKHEISERKRSGSITTTNRSPTNSVSKSTTGSEIESSGTESGTESGTKTKRSNSNQKSNNNFPQTSIHTALQRLYELMKELVTMEKCASTLQRNYRGHRGYLMFRAMKSVQVVARVTREYMHEVDPYRDKVKEYVDKLRKKEWNDWMINSAAEYQQNGWAIWEEVYDNVSGDMYYVNDQTGETIWEPPLDGTPYIPYVPPSPEEIKKLELQKYLEQAKENIKRIEEKANEEEMRRQEMKTAKKMKSFEDGNMNAFMESDQEDENEEDEEDEDAQNHHAWLKGECFFFFFFFSFFFFLFINF